MCKTLYTYLTKLKEKRSSDSPNLFMPYFCGLIYFSNFSRPGSSPSNSSSRHRIGKCKLIFNTGYTSMGREIIQARGGLFELAIQKEERKEIV